MVFRANEMAVFTLEEIINRNYLQEKQDGIMRKNMLALKKGRKLIGGATK